MVDSDGFLKPDRAFSQLAVFRVKHGTTSGRGRMAVIADFKATTLTGSIKQHVDHLHGRFV